MELTQFINIAAQQINEKMEKASFLELCMEDLLVEPTDDPLTNRVIDVDHKQDQFKLKWFPYNEHLTNEGVHIEPRFLFNCWFCAVYYIPGSRWSKEEKTWRVPVVGNSVLPYFRTVI